MVELHSNGVSTDHKNGVKKATSSQPIEPKSEEVQEILGQIPNWIIRWGVTVIFSILGLVLLGTWFVKYPDTIDSRVILTTITPPASIVSRAEGALKLYVRDNQAVRQGDYLGMLENPAKLEDIQYLTGQLNIAKIWLSKGQSEAEFPAFRDQLTLGELQPTYAAFLSTLSDFERSRRLLSHDKQITGLQQRIHQYDLLNEQLEKHQLLLAEELALTQKRFNVDTKLFQEKVISELDYDQSKNSLLQSKRSFQSAQSSIINNQIMISQLREQITTLTISKGDSEGSLRNNIERALKTLESELSTWKQRYVLQTPISGVVALVKFRTDNQFVRAGEEVVVVISESETLYGEVQMPIVGSGKVAVGQRVNIRFDNYPSPEYGMVIGEVASISPVPREGHYTIKIKFPNGLTTSYRKKLQFKQEMQGNAEIITEDLRLIQRVFNQLRTLFDKAST